MVDLHIDCNFGWYLSLTTAWLMDQVQTRQFEPATRLSPVTALIPSETDQFQLVQPVPTCTCW